jgi:hypothetical protein
MNNNTSPENKMKKMMMMMGMKRSWSRSKFKPVLERYIADVLKNTK